MSRSLLNYFRSTPRGAGEEELRKMATMAGVFEELHSSEEGQLPTQQDSLCHLSEEQCVDRVEERLARFRHPVQPPLRGFPGLQEKFRALVNSNQELSFMAALSVVSILELLFRISGTLEYHANTLPWTWWCIEHVFTFFFLLDVLLRLMGFGLHALWDWLCMADTVQSVLDVTCLMLSIGVWPSLTEQSGNVTLNVLRGVRMCLRVVRVLRLKRSLQTLFIPNTSAAGAAGAANVSFQDMLDAPITLCGPEPYLHIMRYNPSKLFRLGWAFNISFSMLTRSSIWVQFLVLLLFTLVYGLSTCVPEDGQRSGFCATPITEEKGLLFSSLVAFLLSLFTQWTFRRWWEVRHYLQKIISNTIDQAALVATLVPDDDEASNWGKQTYVRYLNLAHALVMKQACGNDNLSDLVDRGYLTAKEWALLLDLPSKYSMVYYWSSALARSVLTRAKVPPPVVGRVYSSIGVMREAASSIFMVSNTQMPYILSHLMTFLVKVHLLLICMTQATAVGEAISDSAWFGVIWAVFMLAVSNMFYEGLLQMHEVMYEPLGGDLCDFPERRMQDYVWSTSHHVLLQGQRLPFSADWFDQVGESQEESAEVHHETVQHPTTAAAAAAGGPTSATASSPSLSPGRISVSFDHSDLDGNDPLREGTGVSSPPDSLHVRLTQPCRLRKRGQSSGDVMKTIKQGLRCNWNPAPGSGSGPSLGDGAEPSMSRSILPTHSPGSDDHTLRRSATQHAFAHTIRMRKKQPKTQREAAEREKAGLNMFLGTNIMLND